MADAWLSVTMNDDYGRETRKLLEMESQVDLATYGTVAAAMLTALQAVTDLGVVRADLILPGIASGFAVTSGANRDTGATFQGYIDGGDGKKASTKVPGIKPALVDADGSIDITGVVATYLAAFETAGDFRLSDGETIDSWIKGTLDS
jgi:hypothetical protein